PGRGAVAVGGYLAVITVPTIIGGTLASAANAFKFELLGFPVAPLNLVEALYPDFQADLSPGWWVADYFLVVAASLALVIWRYRTVAVGASRRSRPSSSATCRGGTATRSPWRTSALRSGRASPACSA